MVFCMLINNCDATYLVVNSQTFNVCSILDPQRRTTKDSGSQRCNLEKATICKDHEINA